MMKTFGRVTAAGVIGMTVKREVADGENVSLPNLPEGMTWEVLPDDFSFAAMPTSSSIAVLEGGVISWQETGSLEQVKAEKNLEINAARLAANKSHFVYAGKEIACDELSMIDIQVTNGGINLRGAMRPGWPGGWKCIDNTYVAIPDVETWKLFYDAIEAQGTANFQHSQELKARLQLAQTAEEVAAIRWEL